MLVNSVLLGDMSAFGVELTEADAILMDVVLHHKRKIESEHQFVMLDVRFFLSRLSMAFTGDERLNFLPSAVHAMEERLSGEDY